MIKKIVSKIKSAEKEIEKSATQSGKSYFEAKILAEKKALGTEVYRNFIRTDSQDDGNKHLKIDNFFWKNAAIKPVMYRLYESVKSGNEAQISIDSNSQPDYREKLNEELKALRESEMWRTAEVVRRLRPENN